MWQFGLVTLFVIGASAAYSSSTGAGAGAGAFSGGFAGTGFGGSGGGGGVYGNAVNSNYGSKYPYPNNGAFFGGGGGVGAGSYNPNPGFPSQFPFVPPIQTQQDYSNFVQGFWKQFGSNFQNAATMTYSTPGAAAYAFASSSPSAHSYDLLNQQLAHQANLYSQFNHGAAAGGQFGAAGTGGGGHYGGAGGHYGAGAGTGGGGFYAPNFAGAAASFGPGGHHQAATLIPANPNSPNVDTRFGGDQPVVTVSGGGPPGFVGVSTSSFSSSSDVNGQQQNHRQATTSVNDNGKVTTYTVRS